MHRTLLLSLAMATFIVTANGQQPGAPKPGDDLGTITTISGTVYVGAKLQSVDSDGITILDADGGAKIAFEKLPADLQKKFGYDPGKTVPYAEVEQYKKQIAKLQDENAELRYEVSRFKQALGETQTQGNQDNAARIGYIYYYNYLANEWQLRTGRFTMGPCKGMTPQDAQNYVQQQWEGLSKDDQLACEKKAQIYGSGPDPSAPTSDGNYNINVNQQ